MDDLANLAPLQESPPDAARAANAHAGTADPAGTYAGARRNPVDEQRSRAAAGGHRAVEHLVGGQGGVRRILAEIVLAGFCGPFLEIVGHLEMPGDTLRPIREVQRLLVHL